MNTHSMKIWPEYLDALVSGAKKFEIRHTRDRHFEVGDILVLKEYDPTTETYLDRVATVAVTYLIQGPKWGLPDDMCVMSIVFGGVDGEVRTSDVTNGTNPGDPMQPRVGSALDDVAHERVRQDEKWGGPDHDDAHTTADFAKLIEKRTAMMKRGHRDLREANHRDKLKEIAALAVAAMERIDRKTGNV